MVVQPRPKMHSRQPWGGGGGTTRVELGLATDKLSDFSERATANSVAKWAIGVCVASLLASPMADSIRLTRSIPNSFSVPPAGSGRDIKRGRGRPSRIVFVTGLVPPGLWTLVSPGTPFLWHPTSFIFCFCLAVFLFSVLVHRVDLLVHPVDLLLFCSCFLLKLSCKSRGRGR